MIQASSRKEGEMDDFSMGAQWNITNILIEIVFLKVFKENVYEKRFALPSLSTFQSEQLLANTAIFKERGFSDRRKKMEVTH